MLIFSLDTKKCMNALLLHPAFDSFLFIEGDITTFNTFQFNGRLKKDFFSTEEKEALDDREYALWKELREFCLSLIKGKRTPLGFHFVLSMSAPNIARLLEQEHLSFAPADVQGLYLNFKYDGTKLSCTTGTSMNLFTLDKSLEQAWDKMAQRIFAKYEIPFEVEQNFENSDETKSIKYCMRYFMLFVFLLLMTSLAKFLHNASTWNCKRTVGGFRKIRNLGPGSG